jgi:hypothetical protein
MVTLGQVLAYLFPGITFGPSAECEVYDEQIHAWRLPQPQPTPAEIEAARKPAALALVTERIKSEARRRILARLPEWRQANATALAVELVALGQTNGPEWDALQAAWAWVRATRAHSDALEAQAAALDDPLTLDLSAGWPE